MVLRHVGNAGIFAMFAAILRASSRVRRFIAIWRPVGVAVDEAFASMFEPHTDLIKRGKVCALQIVAARRRYELTAQVQKNASELGRSVGDLAGNFIQEQLSTLDGCRARVRHRGGGHCYRMH